MKCDNVRELMPFLDDGSLEPVNEDSARRHMLKCDSCRKEYTELKYLMDGVRDAILEDAPETVPGYLGLVRRKIRKRKTVRLIGLRVLPAVAAVVFIVSLVLYSFLYERATERHLQDNFSQTSGSIETISEYLRDYRLNEYDLNELVNVQGDTTDQVLLNALLTNSIMDVTPEDIIELMDEDQLNAVMASYEK